MHVRALIALRPLRLSFLCPRPCTCSSAPVRSFSLVEATENLETSEVDLLLRAGFMSNRGRQNVASYLALDLGLDWRKVQL